MRRYETIFILEPDTSEEQRRPLYDKLDEFITRHKGLLVTRDEWGSKHLAYSIRKQSRGFYTRLEYCGDGALVDTMENFFRINERFLKYMTVLLQQDVDIEAVKAEIAAARAQAEAAKTPDTPAETPVTTGDAPESKAALENAETPAEAQETPKVPEAPAEESTPPPETPPVDTPSPETVENATQQKES